MTVLTTCPPVCSRRRLLALAGVVALAGGGAACTASPASAPNGRLRLAMLQPPRSGLSPLSDDAFKLSRWATAQTLLYLDSDGGILAGLATAWSREDELTWRLSLRQGVTFHDGTEMTSDHAAASLAYAAGYSVPPRILDGVRMSVRADGTDLVVSTAEPDALLPQRLTSPQLAILSPAAYPPDGRADGPVDPVGHGTGPFVLTAVDGTAGATLDRFPGYWGSAATLEGIDVTFVPDGTARAAALRSGEADLVEAVPVSQAATIDPSLVHEVPMPRTATLYLNTARGPMSDPAVRAAVRDAVDPGTLVDTMYEGHADVAAGLLGPALSWAAPRRGWGSQPYAGAQGAAARGLVPGAQQAGTVAPGTAITIGSYSDRPELAEAVVVIAQQLEAAGFTVATDVREYAQIEADALAGRFDVFLLSRATVLDSGDPVAYMVSDLASTGSFSLSFLSDDEVDRAGDLPVGQERQDLIMRAEEKILACGAAVPLLHERVLHGEAATVKQAQRDPRERELVTTSTRLA